MNIENGQCGAASRLPAHAGKPTDDCEGTRLQKPGRGLRARDQILRRELPTPCDGIEANREDRAGGIYSLLLQKEGFSPLDYQLFALLAESAASALCAAKLYSDTERKAQTMRGFFDLLTK